MRIISGISKGKTIRTFRGQAIRPTSGRVKESIFNIVGASVRNARVLDLFAGTGNLGMEALSREASQATFVERQKSAVGLIKKNLTRCGFDGRYQVISGGIEMAIRLLHRRGEMFDLLFIDPPYRKGLIEKTLILLEKYPIYHDHSILVIEHDRREALPEPLTRWRVVRKRRFGDTIVTFLNPCGITEPNT